MMLLCHPIMIGFSQDVASLQTAPKPSVQTISTNSKTPLINQYWKKKKHHIKRKQHIKVNDLIVFQDADHISLPMAIYFSQKIHLDKINSLQAHKASTLFVQHSSRGKQRKGKRVCLWSPYPICMCVCINICICVCILVVIVFVFAFAFVCAIFMERERRTTQRQTSAPLEPSLPALPLASSLLPCLLRTLRTMAAPPHIAHQPQIDCRMYAQIAFQRLSL